ncbi:hypothetical protein Tco_1110244 [Tanacetum coccineum]|uniref:Uncharacterized protein n=1 Tax=Tanacetum coccineum TaxID=301880 RepID=A0ABQ5II88_9ASTR
MSPNSLPPGNDNSTLKKDLHEENFQVYSNPLFEFDDNFKSSNVNPLFEENDKDVEIKSSSSFTLTSPEESKFEAYLERDSIPPGIDLTLPPTLEVSSSNPTSPTLTGDKVCSWEERPITTDNCLNFEPILIYDDVVLNDDFYQSNVEDVNSFTLIIWIFLPYFTYTKESPLIFSFRSENFVFDPGIVTFHKLVDSTQQNSLKASRDPVDLSRSIELLILCTDIPKITRKQSKTGKHGHENGRVSKSRKKSQAPTQVQWTGLVRSNQEDSLAHSQSKGHVINGRSTKRCGFCTKFTHTTSTSEPQTDCQLGNPCELTSDPTAIKLDQMIAMIGWQRLKEVGRGPQDLRSFF